MLAAPGILAHRCPGASALVALQVAKDVNFSFSFTLQSMLSFISFAFSCCQITHIFYALNFGSNGLEYLWDPNGSAEAVCLMSVGILCAITLWLRNYSQISLQQVSSHNFWQLVTCSLFLVRTQLRYSISGLLCFPQISIYCKLCHQLQREKCRGFSIDPVVLPVALSGSLFTNSASVMSLNTQTKSNLGEKGLFLYFRSQPIIERGQDRNSNRSQNHGVTLLAGSLEGSWT